MILAAWATRPLFDASFPECGEESDYVYSADECCTNLCDEGVSTFPTHVDGVVVEGLWRGVDGGIVRVHQTILLRYRHVLRHVVPGRDKRQSLMSALGAM